mmetsp:Transcript_71044/g.217746  ORF Transcript_71044/g.217746 Transcript_71044/m.217746 type:complete len:398 (+) Transcript_71044:152-1345(+)
MLVPLWVKRAGRLQSPRADVHLPEGSAPTTRRRLRPVLGLHLRRLPSLVDADNQHGLPLRVFDVSVEHVGPQGHGIRIHEVQQHGPHLHPALRSLGVLLLRVLLPRLDHLGSELAREFAVLVLVAEMDEVLESLVLGSLPAQKGAQRRRIAQQREVRGQLSARVAKARDDVAHGLYRERARVFLHAVQLECPLLGPLLQGGNIEEHVDLHQDGDDPRGGGLQWFVPESEKREREMHRHVHLERPLTGLMRGAHGGDKEHDEARESVVVVVPQPHKMHERAGRVLHDAVQHRVRQHGCPFGPRQHTTRERHASHDRGDARGDAPPLVTVRRHQQEAEKHGQQGRQTPQLPVYLLTDHVGFQGQHIILGPGHGCCGECHKHGWEATQRKSSIKTFRRCP